MSHAEFDDLAPVYALGALDGEDLARFEGHLAGCDACRAQVREYRDASTALAYALPAETPPPLARMRPRRAPWAIAAALLITGTLLFVLLREPAKVSELRGANASGRVERKGGRGVFTASGLPALAPDQVYDLWVIVDGKPRCGGRHYTPDAKGSIHADFELDAKAEGFAVTVESRTGDHREPTMPMVLAPEKK